MIFAAPLRAMKKLILLALIALLPFTRAAAQSIPVTDLQDASGKKVVTTSLIDHKTPFIVSLWMTTCKPCLKELDATAEELIDWDGPKAPRIYAVSIDDSRSLQRAIALSAGSAWDGITPLFDPNGDLRRALDVSAVPQVFIYDKDGNLAYTHIGYRPGDEQQTLATLKGLY